MTEQNHHSNSPSHPRSRKWTSRVPLIAALAGVFITAVAGASGASAAERPWAAGVEVGAQERARTHHSEGLTFMKDAFFVRAVKSFEEALALWDHPGTRFNLAKAYMNLDQSALALRHLWGAMRHGGHPLSLEQVEQVERYAGLLLGEVAVLEVRVERPGRVSLDGSLLFEGPGSWVGLVQPGQRKVELAGHGASGKAEGTLGQFVAAAAGQKSTLVIGSSGAPVSSAGPIATADLEAVQRSSLGFVVRYPGAAERAAWRRPAKAEAPAWTDPGDALLGHAALVCPKAKGDLAKVCREYEQVWRETVRMRRQAEKAKEDALKKLREMTGGGIVEILE